MESSDAPSRAAREWAHGRCKSLSVTVVVVIVAIAERSSCDGYSPFRHIRSG